MEKVFDWDKVTIQDNFLFQQVMKNKRICKKMIEKLLHIKIEKIVYLQGEKTIDIRLDSKGIRLDVYVKDEQGTIYNIEMQTSNKNDELKKRTRYYQALIDMDNLEKGHQYNELKQTFIIFVCTFDVFNKNRHIYTFKNICEEDTTLELGDETTKLFLNSKGTADDVDKDVQAFLQYVDGILTDNEFVQEIDEEVQRVKLHDEWRRSYMTLQMELDKRKQEGLEEGREEGKVEIVKSLLISNASIELIKQVTGWSDEKIKEIATKSELVQK